MCSQATSVMLWLLVVCVSVVCGNVNVSASTEGASGGGSRAAWMKTLLDHHGWMEPLANGTLTLQHQCEDDLKVYLSALNNGKLWASRSEY